MSQQKRIALFFVIVFCWMMATSYVSRIMGWNPPPRKPPAPAPLAKEKGQDKAPRPDLADVKARPVPNNDPALQLKKREANTEAEANKGPLERPDVELVRFGDLVLGSATDKTPTGYRLKV